MLKDRMVDWKTLKAIGWPYSRQHTWRLMAAGRFPQAYKLGSHRNSRVVWKLSDLLVHFAASGLVLEWDNL
jgi:predicted DNA-binding transcriptional regulator AlpA